jgi:hypothetical protein
MSDNEDSVSYVALPAKRPPYAQGSSCGALRMERSPQPTDRTTSAVCAHIRTR